MNLLPIADLVTVTRLEPKGLNRSGRASWSDHTILSGAPRKTREDCGEDPTDARGREPNVAPMARCSAIARVIRSDRVACALVRLLTAARTLVYKCRCPRTSYAHPAHRGNTSDVLPSAGDSVI